jgi:hypothetical protein
LESWANAERIRNAALVRYWEENSGALAEVTGKIQALGQIKSEYRKNGLTEKEIEMMTQGIARIGMEDRQLPNGNVVDSVATNSEQPRQKRQYIRHNKAEQTNQSNNQEVETKTENFQPGTESKVIPEEW